MELNEAIMSVTPVPMRSPVEPAVAVSTAITFDELVRSQACWEGGAKTLRERAVQRAVLRRANAHKLKSAVSAAMYG